MQSKDSIRIPRSQVQYEAGDEIFAEGSVGEEIYVILDGKVGISQNIGGQNETIAILEKGDFFGEMGPITNSPRFATATAAGNVSLEKLSLEEMLWDMHNNQKIMKDMFARMVKRLKDTTTQLNIEMSRSRSIEPDPRMPKVSYLRKKLEEKDTEIEKLQKQLEATKRYRPTRWYLSIRILELAMLLAIFVLVLLRH